MSEQPDTKYYNTSSTSYTWLPVILWLFIFHSLFFFLIYLEFVLRGWPLRQHESCIPYKIHIGPLLTSANVDIDAQTHCQLMVVMSTWWTWVCTVLHQFTIDTTPSTLHPHTYTVCHGRKIVKQPGEELCLCCPRSEYFIIHTLTGEGLDRGRAN